MPPPIIPPPFPAVISFVGAGGVAARAVEIPAATPTKTVDIAITCAILIINLFLCWLRVVS
jgi:hypothetical protein